MISVEIYVTDSELDEHPLPEQDISPALSLQQHNQKELQIP